jgi:hypothetical protein
MDAKEIAQLVHEGYHSLEAIAKWAGMPVWHVEEIYQEYVVAGFYTA